MGQALRVNHFLSAGSEMESVVGNNLITMARWLARLIINPFRAVGYTFLAMFGAWPALAYLIYMAIDS
jgi:hypothetical protein